MNERTAATPAATGHELRLMRNLSGKTRLQFGLIALALVAVALGSMLLFGDPRERAAAFLAGYLYWLGVGAGAAIVLAMLRLSRAEWRRPLARPAELLALLVPLAIALYPLANSCRNALAGEGATAHSGALWPWELGRRGVVIDLAVAAPMALLVALLCWFGIRPDLRAPGRRLTPGALRVWSCLQIVFVIVGLVWLGWGFGMTRVSGWETTLFGPYFLVTSLLHGAAALALLSIGLSRVLGLGNWITPHHLAQLSKLLIGFVLIWFYVQFAEFITVWYGHIPREMAILRARTIETHPALFACVALATFAAPMLYLSFPGLRHRVAGVFAVCSLILLGGIAEWALIFSPAAPLTTVLGLLPMLLLPGALGLLLTALSGSVPPLSIWEIEEGVRARDSVRIGEATIATYALVDLPEGRTGDDRQT